MRYSIFFCFLFAAQFAFAQLDSTLLEDYTYQEDEDVRGYSDTTEVEHRAFDEARLDQLKRSPDLEYSQPPTIAESFWDRFLRWLGEIISSILEGAIETPWGRVISLILGLGIIVIVIMMILKVDAFKVFYSGAGASTMKHQVFDENIHEMDFDKEIQQALLQQDHRRAVRLIFLYALKTLSDGQYIVWEQGKTNYDYVGEVKDESLRKWLAQLSYYFDYAWYGNFLVSRELFDRVNSIFSEQKRMR